MYRVFACSHGHTRGGTCVKRRDSRGVRCWQVAALLAGVTGDYGAMGVVLGVLGINAAIGFHEEHRAQVAAPTQLM